MIPSSYLLKSNIANLILMVQGLNHCKLKLHPDCSRIRPNTGLVTRILQGRAKGRELEQGVGGAGGGAQLG